MTELPLFIPRASVGAFARSPDILSVLYGLRPHPLLARARYEVITGGIDEIIGAYPVGGTPELLILEHDGPIEELERLADVSGATTQLVVISRDNDIGRYRKLIDRGGADYLVAPVTAEVLLASISRTFARAENRRVGRLVTFFSCGGSGGSSTVAQNAAVLLSLAPDTRVLLLDFDVYSGTVALTFDLNPMRGLLDLLRDPRTTSAAEIGRLAQDRSVGLQILCSPPTLEPGFAMRVDHFIDILDKVRSLADFVVIDMPGGWSLLHRQLLTISDHAALVVGPDLGGVQVLSAIGDLAGQHRQNLPPPDVVLNRWTPAADRTISPQVFQGLAKDGRLVRVGDLGPALVQAAEAGKAVAELTERPPALQELDDYAATLSGRRRVAPPAPAKGLMGRLLRRKAR